MPLEPELLQHIFKTVGDNSSTVYIIYDLKEQKPIFISPFAEKLSGRDLDFFYQDYKTIFEIIHPDDRQFVEKKLEKLAGEAFEKNIEFRILDKKNYPIYIRLKIMTINDKYGEQKWLMAFAEDISQRKESDLNLLDINEKKDATLQILAHDLRGTSGPDKKCH